MSRPARWCSTKAVAALVAVATAGVVAPTALPAAPAEAAVRPCSRGLVALTFDDGPATAVTGRLLDVLDGQGVPATFFVVGSRVRAAPALVRSAHRRGFVIANHTYAHENLTRLSDDAIRSTLRRTGDAIRGAGARPTALVRPPYGATNDRVRRVTSGMAMTQVLWDIDPRDWASGSAAQITARVLDGLRPGGRNIVLLHDGVGRSPTTLAAVPGIIRGARERGYCFARLGPAGRPVPPVPALTVADARVQESDPGTPVRLSFALRLDRPTSRAVSVRVRTVARNATAGEDYRSVTRRVELAAGTRTRTVEVRVRGDRAHEGAERVRLVADRPRGLVLGDASARGVILDDDPLPRVRLSHASVTEPPEGTATAQVRLTADRPSGRRMVMVVSTAPDTADETDYHPLARTVRVAPGETSVLVPVTVVADALDEPAELFHVRIVSAEGAAIGQGDALVTILPPPAPDPGG